MYDVLIQNATKMHVYLVYRPISQLQIQIQIQMGICRARLTNCPGTLTNVRMLCETGKLLSNISLNASKYP